MPLRKRGALYPEKLTVEGALFLYHWYQENSPPFPGKRSHQPTLTPTRSRRTRLRQEIKAQVQDVELAVGSDCGWVCWGGSHVLSRGLTWPHTCAFPPHLAPTSPLTSL